MTAEYFATGARWRQLLDDYYARLVGDDPAVEPKRPVRPDDEDIEIEPPDPSSFTQGNPFAKDPDTDDRSDGGGATGGESSAPGGSSAGARSFSPHPSSTTTGDRSTDLDDRDLEYREPGQMDVGAEMPLTEHGPPEQVVVEPGDNSEVEDFDDDTDTDETAVDEAAVGDASSGDEPSDDDGDNA